MSMKFLKEQSTMTLTKAQLIKEVRAKNGFTKQKTIQTVETTLEIIKKTLQSGEDVLISGFGKFSVKMKQARKGRNPATGDDMMLADRKVVTFKCSGKLRDGINRP